MGVAVWALIIYIALIITWAVVLKRNIGEAMIVGFVVTAFFGGAQAPELMWNGLLFGATHEVLFAGMAFVFMAFLVEKTGLMNRLIDILNALLGRLPGGAGYVDTVASALFGTIAGSGSGNTAAVGSITIPWMTRSKWPKEYAATVAAGNAGMGISFPPSGSMFILLGSAPVAALITEGQLFVALFVAGLYTLIYRLIVTGFFIKRHKIKAVSEDAILSFSAALSSGWSSLLIFLGIIIPVVITIGPFSEYLAGSLIGEEAVDIISIIVWVPVLIIALTVIIGWKSIPKSIKGWNHFLEEAIPSFSVIGVILLFSFSASDVLNELGLPEQLGGIMDSLSLSPWLVALVIGLLIVLVASPLTATATVTAIGTVAFTAMVSSGINPVVAAVAILVFASTEGASPPGGAPIFIASGLARANPLKTFLPLVIYYVIPITIIGWLIAMEIIPIPGA